MHQAVQEAGQKEHFGDSEALQLEATNLLGPSRPSRGRAAHEEGEGPICAAPHKKALLSHTKQEKSVFVAQLSLSTTNWAKAFKHSKKKRRTCENATKEMPLKTLLQQIKNQTKSKINAIKAESNYNASKGEGSWGEGHVTVFIFFLCSGIVIKGRTQWDPICHTTPAISWAKKTT